MVTIRTLLWIGSLIALLALAFVGSSQPVFAYPVACVSSASSAASLMGGNASDWHVKHDSWGNPTGARFHADSDTLIKAPTFGRLDFAGGHLWSDSSHVRRVWIRTTTFWCSGKQGASQGYPLSQTPRTSAMAAQRLGGTTSNWTRKVGSESTGWNFSAQSSTQLKTVYHGRLDTPAGSFHKNDTPPPTDRATFWYNG